MIRRQRKMKILTFIIKLFKDFQLYLQKLAQFINLDNVILLYITQINIMSFQNSRNQSKDVEKQNNKPKNKVIIRSKLFKQKFQRLIPKIYDKQIITHRPNYAAYLNTQFKLPQSQKNPQIWGCLIPPKRKSKSISISLPIRQVNTPQNLFRKYIVRKSRLSYGPNINPQLSLENENALKSSERTKRYKSKDNLSKTARNFDTGLQIKQQESSQSFLTNQDITNLNSKSIYKMSVQELQQSIRWKKQFLEIFQQKINKTKSKLS